MRRIVPYLLAALLGAGSALLAACGSGTEAGIPSANAIDLKSQINDVRQAVEDGRCSDVPGQLRQVDDGIDDLPPSVDDHLVTNLRDGADKLLSLAREECNAETETTTTETTTKETTGEPAQTTTAPAQTTTTEEPAKTTTEPAPQPPPPPEPEPEPEPEPVPPPPVEPPGNGNGTPGGGTKPVIP